LVDGQRLDSVALDDDGQCYAILPSAVGCSSWLSVEFCAEVVGATSSEGLLVRRQPSYFIDFFVADGRELLQVYRIADNRCNSQQSNCEHTTGTNVAQYI